MITSFLHSQDTGIMTPEEAADFLVLELNGDKEQAKSIAVRTARNAVMKVK